MSTNVIQKVNNPNFPSGGASGTTGTGNLVFSESPTINNANLTGSVSANVNLRSGFLADLLQLAGGVSEIGYATDVDTLVKFNGVAGQAEVYGRYTNGTTRNFIITTANLASITNPASGVYIDCNNVSYLVITIDPAVVTLISNINIKLPYHVSIGSLGVSIPQANDGVFDGTLTITLGYQAADIASGSNAYFSISADGTALIPSINTNLVAALEISFISVGTAGWTRTARAGEAGFVVLNGADLVPSSIGYTQTGTEIIKTLTVSGTVYNSGSIVINPGVWLLTGSAIFTTSANLNATAISAAAGLDNIATNPSSVTDQLKVQIQSNLAGGTSYTLAMSPKVVVMEFAQALYGNATFTAAAGNLGTVSATVYMKAVRLA